MGNLLEGGFSTQHELMAEAVPDARIGTAIRAIADLERDTAGQVRPRYEYVRRRAGQLACHELVLEPMLGPVRVAGIAGSNGRYPEFVRVTWSDDCGPSRAAARYPADRLLPVRIPHQADRLLIRQGIDQATWRQREIPAVIARLIAAHLHLGPRSALYGFAVRGTVPEQLYDELDGVSTAQPTYRPWADALARHCLGRGHTGPMPGWGPEPPAKRHTKPTAGTEPVAGHGRRPRQPRTVPGWPLLSKRMTPETAMELMDAAFALGLEAGRSGARSPRPRRPPRQPART